MAQIQVLMAWMERKTTSTSLGFGGAGVGINGYGKGDDGGTGVN